jgi:hypothetical protein
MAASLPNLDATTSEIMSQPEDLVTIPKTSTSSQSINDSMANGGSYEQAETSPLESSGTTTKVVMDPRRRISNLLKDKEKEWTAVAEKKGPLRLLDLPMDVLKEIVKEVGFSGL